MKRIVIFALLSLAIALPDPAAGQGLLPASKLSQDVAAVEATCDAEGDALDLTGNFGGTKDQRLAKADTLRSLTVHHSNITDAGLKHLAPLGELRALTIGIHPNLVPAKSFGDEGLKHLASLKKLECLSLSAQQVTKDGIAHLQELPNLRQLNLNLGWVTEQSLRQHANENGFAEEPAPKLSVEALAALGELHTLEQLTLADYSFPPTGLRQLRNLKKLKELNLAHTPVDDESVRQLQALPQLEALDLRGTAVTPQGIAALRARGVHVVGVSDAKVVAAGKGHLVHWIDPQMGQLVLPGSGNRSLVIHTQLPSGDLRILARGDTWSWPVQDALGRMHTTHRVVQNALHDATCVYVLVTTTTDGSASATIDAFQITDGRPLATWEIKHKPDEAHDVFMKGVKSTFRLIDGGVSCHGQQFHVERRQR